MEQPDFEALRAKRNAAVDEMVRRFTGGKYSSNSFDKNSCYCSCGSEENLCEHNFEGWRDLMDADGNVLGGETVCSRCGMGAMSHSLRCGM